MQLRDWLHRNRMSLSQFAREIGTSKQLLSMQLYGDRPLSLSIVITKHTEGAVKDKDLRREIQDNREHRERRRA